MSPERPRRLLRAVALRGLREPVRGLALAAGAAVLALAVCAAPLYRTAVGNVTIADAVEGFDGESLGLTIGAFGPLEPGRFDAADRAVRAATAGTGLPPPVVTVSGDAAVAGPDRPADRPALPVQLFARTGAVEHLPEPRPCAAGGDGVWLQASTAAALALDPCDEVVLSAEGGQRAVTVAGVYRDLLDVLETRIWTPVDPLPADSPIAAYWAPFGGRLVELTPMGQAVPRPPLVVAEPREMAAAGRPPAFGPAVAYQWIFPFAVEDVWIEDVVALIAVYDELAAEAQSLDTALGTALAAAAHAPYATFGHSSLPQISERVTAIVASVDTALGPAGTTGRAAALLALALAGVFEARRRRGEWMLAAAQGSASLAIAGRTAVEAVVPVAAGTLAGVALATGAVGLLAPGPLPGRESIAGALGGAAAWGLGAVVLLAGTAALQARRAERPAETARARGRWRHHPWEVVPLTLAVAAYWTLARRGDVLLALDAETVEGSIDATYVLFPLLVLACGAGLAARLLRRLGPPLARLTARAPASAYLAARRLAGTAAPAALVALAALGTGLLVYAAAVGASAARTAATSAGLFAGAPATTDLPVRAEVGLAPFPTTEVSRDQGVVQPTGVEVDVLAIDADTFGSVASWQDRFASRPLGTLLAALHRPQGEAVPVLLVGAAAPERPSLETTRYRLPIVVVASPSAFPGMTGRRPLLVADSAVLADAVNASGQSTIDEALMQSRFRELWAAAGREEFGAFLRTQDLHDDQLATAADLRRQPRVAAARWALGYLQAVGAGAGLLGLVAVALYLHGAQRARDAAGLLLARMGLSRRQHRRAIALELAGLVAFAVAAGALPGLLAARLVVGTVDTLPRVGPPPQFVLPWQTGAAVVAAAAVTCLAGAWLAQRASDRADPAAVLRAGD